jgi:predicted RNA binding protein with dsRBD fold (UPF0201 family)
MIQQKNTKESSEDDHLRITTNKQVATRAKTSFAEKKKIKIIEMAFIAPHMRKHTNTIQSLKN